MGLRHVEDKRFCCITGQVSRGDKKHHRITAPDASAGAIWSFIPYVDQDVHDEEIRLTNEELIAVGKDLPTANAPGPDGFPNIAKKKTAIRGSFTDIWRRQK